MFSTSESQRTWTSVKSSEAVSGKLGPKDCRSQREAKVVGERGVCYWPWEKHVQRPWSGVEQGVFWERKGGPGCRRGEKG